MPLINLSTNLKNLRYGHDRPGGGSSGLPYVLSPNPDAVTSPTNVFTDFYSNNRNTSDFPIRGGSITIGGEAGLPTTPAGEIDRLRIKAFLSDPKRGKIFLLKQTGLQLTNPKTQGPSILTPLSGESITGLLEETRFYNPSGITTYLQSYTQGTGTHIRRDGLAVHYNTGIYYGYEQFVRNNNEEGTNRLSILMQAKLGLDRAVVNAFTGRGVDYGVSILNSEILNYQGGPGSTYGIGNTIIKRATNTNTGRTYGTIAFTYDTIMNQAPTASLQEQTYINKTHPRLQDFRQIINKQSGKNFLMTGSYDTNNIETRLKIQNPTSPLKDRNVYNTPSTNTKDQLNAYPLYYYRGSDPLSVSLEGVNSPPSDMIKFVFECLSNDEPNSAEVILFRSFLTNFTDSNQAEFNAFRYMGRGENFRVYQGFDRSIGFSFKIAAFTRDEMAPLYTKLNHLVSQVYPDYARSTNFMRGNIIRLTIGDYLYRVPGFLENVNITVEDNIAWEIALESGTGGADENMRQLPQAISVQCSFKPIHDMLPRRQSVNEPYIPLIANTPTEYLLNKEGIKQAN